MRTVQWRFGTVMYCIGQLMMSHVEDDDVIKQMVEEDSCSRWQNIEEHVPHMYGFPTDFLHAT